MSQSNLLYRLNCHDDKQPVVVICSSLDSGLLGTAVQVSKSHHNSTIKPLIQSSPILFPDDKLALHVSVLNFQQSLLCMRYAKIYFAKWLAYKHTMSTVRLWGSANWGINILVHAHSHNAWCYYQYNTSHTENNWTLALSDKMWQHANMNAIVKDVHVTWR